MSNIPPPKKKNQAWWHIPLIPALWRQIGVCRFKFSLVYLVSSRTVYKVRPCLKQTNNKNHLKITMT